MQLIIADRDVFDRSYVGAFNLGHRHETAIDDLAVNQNCTSAALALATSFLRAGEMKLLAQDIEQALHRKGAQRARLVIDGAVNVDLVRQVFLSLCGGVSMPPQTLSLRSQASTGCD